MCEQLFRRACRVAMLGDLIRHVCPRIGGLFGICAGTETAAVDMRDLRSAALELTEQAR